MMNIKLIVGSVLGIGSLGGAGYYFLKHESTTKNEDNTNSETKSSEYLNTNKETTPDLQTQPKTAELSSVPTPKEPAPDSRRTTSTEPLATELGASGSSNRDNALSQTTREGEDVQRAVET